MVMDSLETTSAEELLRRYAPELVPQTDDANRIIAQITIALLTAAAAAPVVLITLAAVGMQSSPLNILLTSIAGLAGAVVGAVVGDRRYSREHQEALRRFSKQLKDSPWKFYEAVALKFAAEIERQRARTIGSDTEWGRARLRLESAAQEADRSLAYWTQRLSIEPGNEIARTQLTAATRLRDKFHTALAGLDQRARLLVTFFNDCEARVAVLQSAKRDFEEIRKLDLLADGSDEIVIHAEETLASIGTGFVSEALRVGNALGGLERVGLVNLAGAVSVDHLEALADRIVESADRDRTALEQVTRSI
jgi:hypothetical protein